MPLKGFDTYKRLLTYTQRYWRWVMLAVTALLLLSICEALFAWGVKPVVDSLTSNTASLTFKRYLPLMFFGLIALRGLFAYVSDVSVAYLSQNVIQTLRKEVYTQLLYLPKTYHDRHTVADSISVMLYNITQISTAVSTAVLQFLQNITLILGLFVAMLMIHWQLTLLSTAFILPTVYLVVYFSKRIRLITHASQKNMAQTTQILNDSLRALPMIKLTHVYAHANQKFIEQIRALIGSELKSARMSALCSMFSQLIVSLPITLLIWLTVTQAFSSLSAGTFAALFLAFIRIQRPIKQLTKLNLSIQKGIAASESIFAIIDHPIEPNLLKPAVQQSALIGQIQFDDVTFTYPFAHSPAVQHFSMNIQPGQFVAIVGQSGSGKSTLLNLLAHFYTVESGNIYLDNQPIKSYSLEFLRTQIAFVTQDLYMFNASVSENINLNLSQSPQEIEVAAKAAAAHDFIMQLPQGYDTVIGEEGGLLSGGQRQRITLARAFFQSTRLIVLDEATSALDNFTDELIMQYLSTRKDQTVIAITHRLSNLKYADSIVLMHEGSLVAQGTHESLLKDSTLYRKLYEKEDAM